MANKLTKPSEGYFLAKRRVADAIIGRIEVLEKEREGLSVNDENIYRIREIGTEIDALERFRSHVRNSLLWDTSEGL